MTEENHWDVDEIVTRIMATTSALSPMLDSPPIINTPALMVSPMTIARRGGLEFGFFEDQDILICDYACIGEIEYEVHIDPQSRAAHITGSVDSLADLLTGRKVPVGLKEASDRVSFPDFVEVHGSNSHQDSVLSLEGYSEVQPFCDVMMKILTGLPSGSFIAVVSKEHRVDFLFGRSQVGPWIRVGRQTCRTVPLLNPVEVYHYINGYLMVSSLVRRSIIKRIKFSARKLLIRIAHA